MEQEKQEQKKGNIPHGVGTLLIIVVILMIIGAIFGQ